MNAFKGEKYRFSDLMSWFIKMEEKVINTDVFKCVKGTNKTFKTQNPPSYKNSQESSTSWQRMDKFENKTPLNFQSSTHPNQKEPIPSNLAPRNNHRTASFLMSERKWAFRWSKTAGTESFLRARSIGTWLIYRTIFQSTHRCMV